MKNTSNSQINWSVIVGYWGALLSTFLAVRTIFLGRIRIYARLDLNVSIDGYFMVKLTNLTPKPIFINYYVFYFDNRKTGEIDVDLHEYCDKQISARNSEPIYIEDRYLSYFKKKKGKLYVDLYIIGRYKPKRVKILI